MNNKKFRKLLRDPKLFFRDMYAKRVMKLKKYLPLKYEGNNQFTIVSAVYNVEKYLDEYFDSIVKQSLNFKKHIQIILVDDGSTDHSAEIIKRWQAKFPQNIHYFYKENGGQASARNLGLQHTQTEWVTFIDPDDFVSPNYFWEIDKVLHLEKEVTLISVPIAVYKENTGSYSYDTAPLSYCFKDNIKKIRISDLKNKIQLSVCSALFKTKVIQNNGLYFDEKIKPSFEDGKFVADYFLAQTNEYIYFLDTVYYFYRTREDGGSTTNTQWQKKEKYIDVFKHGYLVMFENYMKKYNNVPLNIQFTFLYFAIQYIKLLIKNEHAISFLTNYEKEEFLRLFYKCFNYIDKQTIMQFNLHGCSFFYKAGMINLFKNEEVNFTMVYVNKIDYSNNLIEIYFYAKDDVSMEYYINGKYSIPAFRKEKGYSFLDKTFINEYRIWIPIDEFSTTLEIKSKSIVKIVYNKQEYTGKFLLNTTTKNNPISITEKPWIFIDKETKADDNAEHLYRYIAKKHPNQPIYFVLNKDSIDWTRLKKSNFNLLEFNSPLFKRIYKEASVIFSSHCDKYFTEYFGRDTLKDKKFVFLQHGVIMHDLSEWLNNVPKIDIFCTSTIPEYNFIGGEKSPYKYSYEVKLTGLARHDMLMRKAKKYISSKNIVIMPTWRNHVVGPLKSGTVTRELNPDFKNTDYFKHWYEFLHSHEVKRILDEYGYTLTFIPHPNITDYLPLFNLPDYIESPINAEDFSIQDYLSRSCLLITDYSSITFDMAFLERGTLYYQFDSDTFFSGNHTSNQGYFDYKRDGFGPIAYSLQELLDSLQKFVMNHRRIYEPYKTRLKNLYPNRDGKNCKRIYDVVMSLQEPTPVIDEDRLSLLKNMINRSESIHAWDLAARRIQTLLDTGRLNAEETADYRHRYLNALFESKQFDTLQNLLPDYPDTAGYWHAKIDLYIGNAVKGAEFFAENEHIGTQNDLLIALLAASFHQAKRPSEKLFARIGTDLPDSYQPLLTVAQKLSEQNYFVALALLKTYIDSLDDRTKGYLKPELLASYLCMKLGNLQGAHQFLVAFEKHTQNDPSCRIAIARLAKLRGDSEKLFTQLNRAFEENLLLIPEDLTVDYLKKMYATGNTDGERYLLAQLRQKYPENPSLALYEAEKLAQNQDWESVTKILADFAQTSPETIYLYTTALCRLKNHQAAQCYFDSLSLQDTAAYWKLAAEIAEAKGDKVLQAECLKKQLACLE